MNYYRRYVGDYQRKTMRLDPTDHGVYDLMLDYYYAEELPLPLEIDDIYAICKAIRPEHRKSVSKVLGLYFERRPDGFHNKRADEEIAVSQQARLNGKGHTGKRTGKATDEPTGGGTGSGTGNATGEGGGSVHPPTTNHQPPTASPQPLSPSRQGKTKGARFALPEWVPPDAWGEFVTMRQRIRKPLTERAKELIVAKLDTLRSEGHMPTPVLEQSVLKSWQDVYPISAPTNGAKGQNGAADITERNRQRTADWVPPEAGEVLP